MLSSKSQSIILERDQGRTVIEVGQRFGCSHQNVSNITTAARKFVDAIELDLMLAAKTGEQCAYVIPFGPDYQVAMKFGDWLIRQLRSRDVKLQVSVQRAHNGLAILLSDITAYGGSE